MADAVVEVLPASASEKQTEEALNAPTTADVKVQKEPEAEAEKAVVEEKGTETVQEQEKAAETEEKAATEVNPDGKNEGSKAEPDKGKKNQDRQAKGSYRPHHKKDDFSRNIKSDYSSLPESNDHAAIRKQVEFYFSDSNLATDKFLYTQLGGSENNAVPIETIHSFKRMRRFQPLSAVIAALKESKTLEVVKDDTAIKRKTPLIEGFELRNTQDVRQVIEDKSMARSIYAKGFGDEEPGTQFDIEAFFEKFGPTNQVRLRRDYTKTFKGSVFVEFDSEETQKQFLALDPKPKYNGRDLVIKSKKRYCDDKVEDINAGKVRQNEPKGSGHRLSRNGKEDHRDWRERRDEDKKNGFRNDRNGRGRGRGRGRGGRFNDRNEERKHREERENNEDEEGNKEAETAETKNDLEEAKNHTGETAVAEDKTNGHSTATEEESSKKRPLDEFNVEDQGPAKKQKDEVAAES